MPPQGQKQPQGQMVKLVYRLAELEEETLRSELRTIIRTGRAAGPHYEARVAPEPPTPNRHLHETGPGHANQDGEMDSGSDGDTHPWDNTTAWEGWDADPDIVSKAEQSPGPHTFSPPTYKKSTPAGKTPNQTEETATLIDPDQR